MGDSIKVIFTIMALLAIKSLCISETMTITLSNAIEISLHNNLQIQQSEQDIRIAEAQYNESFADFALPGINLGANVTFNDITTATNSISVTPVYSNIAVPYPVTPTPGGSPTNGFTVVPTTTVTSFISNQEIYIDNYSVSLGITKTLFAGFKLWNALSLKKYNLDYYKMKLDDQKRQTIADVSTSFYNLFLIRENYKAQESLNEDLKDQVDFIRAQYRVGLSPQYDLISAEVKYENNIPILLQLSNSFISARLAFLNLLNIKDNPDYEIIGNIADATNIILTNLDENIIIPLALSNDFNLKTLDYTLLSYKISRDIEEGNKFPLISAFFNYEYNYTKADVTTLNRTFVPSWNTGLEMIMPLDALIPISRVSQTSEELSRDITKTELARSDYIASAILQIKNLLMQLKLAYSTMDSQYQNVIEAKLGYKLASERYHAGTSSLLEVSDAEVSLSQAEAGYLQAVYNYYSATVSLKRMAGW